MWLVGNRGKDLLPRRQRMPEVLKGSPAKHSRCLLDGVRLHQHLVLSVQRGLQPGSFGWLMQLCPRTPALCSHSLCFWHWVKIQTAVTNPCHSMVKQMLKQDTWTGRWWACCITLDMDYVLVAWLSAHSSHPRHGLVLMVSTHPSLWDTCTPSEI